MTLFNKLDAFTVVEPVVSTIRIPALADKIRYTFTRMNEFDATIEKYGKAGRTNEMLEVFGEVNALKDKKWADDIDELLRLERDGWKSTTVSSYKTTFDNKDNKHYINTTIKGGNYIIFGGSSVFVFYALNKQSNELKSVIVRNIGYISLDGLDTDDYEISITIPQTSRLEFWLIK